MLQERNWVENWNGISQKCKKKNSKKKTFFKNYFYLQTADSVFSEVIPRFESEIEFSFVIFMVLLAADSAGL